MKEMWAFLYEEHPVDLSANLKHMSKPAKINQDQSSLAHSNRTTQATNKHDGNNHATILSHLHFVGDLLHDSS